MKMDEETVEGIEVDLLLEALRRRYGYDFRSYARATVERRVRQFLSEMSVASIADAIPRLLHDESFAITLMQHFSISVTEMFRDPEVYHVLRSAVVPLLKTYPHVKVWHAGCATGEEVYSMAILLREEGLYERATIFGTDFNDAALQSAKAGIYPLQKIQEFTKNYQRAGGRRSFADYYHADYDSALIDSALKRRVTFANHNLVTDTVFGEMTLILCRNVMIYFNQELRARALRLFTESLVRGGFLCIGTREDLTFSEVVDAYEVVDAKARIYKKKAA
ncbi:MAG: protein-glutamate O-methyltransferase CheR [Myxococcales bacterium]|nr:protein-glutamate O-methyltransferase CheR [Myxococcales bacterium]